MVRVCVRIKGEIRVCPANSPPLKMALPKVAAAPQQRVAAVIRKCPRHGWGFTAATARSGPSLCKHLFQSLGIKTDHYLIANNNGWSGTAVIFVHQFKNCLLVNCYILDFEIDASLREEGFRRITGRSARLTENDNFLLWHCCWLLENQQLAASNWQLARTFWLLSCTFSFRFK